MNWHSKDLRGQASWSIIYIPNIGLISSRVPEADQILPKYRGFLLLANEVLKQLQFR